MQAQYGKTLKSLNLKATPKRLAILRLLGEKRTYASPEDIWQKLKGQFSRIGLPTVYRNLDELAAGGCIGKVIHPNRQLYYSFLSQPEPSPPFRLPFLPAGRGCGGLRPGEHREGGGGKNRRESSLPSRAGKRPLP